MQMAQPWFLLLLLLLIPLVYYVLRRGRQDHLRFSDLRIFASVKQLPHVKWLPHIFLVLRVACLVCIVVALTRPQTVSQESKRKTEVFDIVLAIDTSESMAALDFELDGERRTRLDIVKSVLKPFINERSGDRIGLVVFGQEAFTQAPLTLDHDILLKLVDQMHLGMAGRATAIGSALAVSTKRLEDQKAKSKIVILLTDGENTAGKVQPMEAAAAAKTLGVRVYTIAIGKSGRAPFAAQGIFGATTQYYEVPVDFELLKRIAKETGGKAFQATNTKALAEIYSDINKMERTEVEVEEYFNYTEHFQAALWPALLLLLLEMVLNLTRWRRIP